MLNRHLEFQIPKVRIKKLRYEQGFCLSNFSILDRWNLSDLLGKAINDNYFPTFDEMYRLWVGKSAERLVSVDRVSCYREYLSTNFPHYDFDLYLKEIVDERWPNVTEADLSALHSVMHIMHLIGSMEDSRLVRILEIGGGFGHLGQLLHKFCKTKHQYMLMDAVPESIAYAELFLKKFNLFKGYINSPEELEIAREGAFLIPSWRAEWIPDKSVDLIINISSMQEMPDLTADTFLQKFPNWLRLHGLLFFANSRDHYYEREYSFPPSLHLERKDYSPRSRSPDFPIEVYRKLFTPPDSNIEKINYEYFSGLKNRINARNKLITDKLLRNVNSQREKIKQLNISKEKLTEKNRYLLLRLERFTKQSEHNILNKSPTDSSDDKLKSLVNQALDMNSDELFVNAITSDDNARKANLREKYLAKFSRQLQTLYTI